MKIDREKLSTCPPEEAAEILYDLGKTLKGTNLKKSSWLLIANSLRVQRIAEIILRRLQAASTRQDALRVLRIARKNIRPQKASKGATRQPPKENPYAVVAETSSELYRLDEVIDEWELEEAGWYQRDYEEWLEEKSGVNQSKRQRVGGLRAVSGLQDAIDRYAWERQPTIQMHDEELRSRIDRETYNRLLDLTSDELGLNLTDPEIAFLREHNLRPLLEFALHPRQRHSLEPLRDGISLAGMRIIEDHTGPHGHPFQVDWDAAAGWLAERLVLKPQPDLIKIVIASAYAFFRAAPPALVIQFLKASAGWHPAWISLLWYAYQRRETIIPDIPPRHAPPGWHFFKAYVVETGWERVLDAGTGSRLVLHNLRNNMIDLFTRPVRIKNDYLNGVRQLLLAGGGTLRRMEYPAFTLICRPSITLVRMDTFTALAELAAELAALHEKITALNRGSLAAWIESTFNQLTQHSLPDSLSVLIAGTIERHAAAYLMLKERVLRDALQAAPFRLRRKHIQRFWDDLETGTQQTSQEPAGSVPMTLEALIKEFGADGLKEALAHALLDHFKDDWGLPEDGAHAMKETLLTLLRNTAITYRKGDVWLPPPDWNINEDDLQHTQEVANFLIQQTEHAPLEIAQAMRIDPRQGLPLLAGGQMTAVERRARRLVKETAGLSQKKIAGAEARTFTCRPLSKVRALDRSDLGGDCSSSAVPMRVLSPHHNYFGIFENGEQQRGYMTVYEAWAALDGEEETGERMPVLCLETINVPLRIFDAVQQDLLVIFEAIAKSRGLAEGLVLITTIGTWNYQNGEVLRQSRRFRQGTPVRLYPADPASWNVYKLLAHEAQSYTAFIDKPNYYHSTGSFRLLAPFQPELDPIEPENLLEAQRIAAIAPEKIRLIASGENGPAGFISALPKIL